MTVSTPIRSTITHRGAERIRTADPGLGTLYEYEQPGERLEQTELVYFAQAMDGPIKIGVTGNLAARINQIQVNNAREIIVLGAFEVPKGHEKRLHKRLSQHVIRGEWFAPHQDVYDALAACEFVAETLAELEETEAA